MSLTVCEWRCWWCVSLCSSVLRFECESGVQKWARVFVRLEAAPDVQFALQPGLNELLDHRFTLTCSQREIERDRDFVQSKASLSMRHDGDFRIDEA